VNSTLAQADAEFREKADLAVQLGAVASVVEGALSGLKRSDWWVPGRRELPGAVLRGVAVDRVLSDAGLKPYRIAPGGTSPALRALTAVGLAMAESDRVALVHLGVGSVADGAFAEALNLAALHGAKVIFVVAVLDLEGAPVPQQSAASASALAAAFGVHTVSVNGLDAQEVASAVASAREHGGPVLIEARLSAGAGE